MQGAAPGVALRYATALLSRSQVEQLDALVSLKRKELRAAGVRIVMWGIIDGPAAPYVITYDGDAPTAEMASVFEIFGPGTVVFRQGSAQVLGRYNDTSPFYGGSNIVASNSGSKFPCTSGFAAKRKSDGKRFLTMAWHCVKLTDPRAWISNGTFIGPITDLFPLGFDAALIAPAKGSSPVIFDGANPNDTQTKAVVGSAGFAPGVPVCVSGSYARTICNAKMREQAFFIVENLYSGKEWEVHGFLVRRDTNAALVVDGDSGGPVFTNTNNNTQAVGRGTISAGLEPVLCPTYLNGHQCFRTALVVDLARLGSALDLTFSGF
jgi:hypothetical protein